MGFRTMAPILESTCNGLPEVTPLGSASTLPLVDEALASESLWLEMKGKRPPPRLPPRLRSDVADDADAIARENVRGGTRAVAQELRLITCSGTTASVGYRLRVLYASVSDLGAVQAARLPLAANASKVSDFEPNM